MYVSCEYCIALEERVAHAELGRDNACAQRDQVLERTRRARASAGRRIAELVDLVEKLCQETPESTRDWARGRLEVILAPGAEKRVAQ